MKNFIGELFEPPHKKMITILFFYFDKEYKKELLLKKNIKNCVNFKKIHANHKM